MHKFFDHSEKFLDDLLTNSEFMLQRYRKDERPQGEMDQGKMVTALFAYLYALHNKDMIDMREDGVTPARIKKEYKQTAHYQENHDAREIARHVSQYLKRVADKEAHDVYSGILAGLEAMTEAKSKHPVERELAGQLGVVAFKIGILCKEPGLTQNAIKAIGNVPNERTRKRFHEELDRVGLLDLFKQLEQGLRETEGGSPSP